MKINSPGGDLFAGNAIYNTLKNHAAPVTVYIDGVAASSASIIAMAGDTVIMPRNAMMMIHEPYVGVEGNASTLEETAAALRKITAAFGTAYQEKSGLDQETVAKMMAAETWLTPDEAVEKGFADEIDNRSAVTTTAQGESVTINGLSLKAADFKSFPQALLAVASNSQPTPKEPGRNTEDTMKIKELIASLRRFFGADKYPQINSALDVVHNDIPEDASVESAAARIHQAFQGTIDGLQALIAPLATAGVTTADQITALLNRAKAGDAYRAELVTDTLAAGVRAKGDKFDADAKARYERLFEAMSLDDIKAQKAEWDDDAKARLGTGGRQAQAQDPNAQPKGAGDADVEAEGDETAVKAFLDRTGRAAAAKPTA